MSSHRTIGKLDVNSIATADRISVGHACGGPRGCAVQSNSANLRPLERLTTTMAEQRPDNLLLFVTLSTHDGRSIQGIGIDRTDGHVNLREFSGLSKVAEAAGGKVKYRAVQPGRIPSDTFDKICGEMGVPPSNFSRLFRKEGDDIVLLDPAVERESLLDGVYSAAKKGLDDPDVGAAAEFLADWVIAGRAPYELCCTSRAAFDPKDSSGRMLSPEEEAGRLALAQGA